jgi:chaperonin cofactor prefoldin
LEGPTDQFIFAELVRLFSTQETIGELIDLNSLTIVSADSATGVEKLLEASQWGDEPIPATVVLLDSDSEGDIVFEKITGKARNKKRMIEDEFVARIKDCFGVEHGAAITIEDIIPIRLFSGAILAYVAHWYPNLAKESEPKIRQGIEKTDFGANGLVSGGQNLFKEIKLENSGYDKMGVLQELVRIVAQLQRDKPDDQDLKLLRANTLSLCAYLKKKIEDSRQVAKRRSGKQSVQRIIHDFLVSHKHSVVTYDLQMHFERLQNEADALGQDGEKLKVMLVTWINEIQAQRNAGQKRLSPEQWKKWASRLAVTHHNPLDPSAAMEANLPKEHLAEPKEITVPATS